MHLNEAGRRVKMVGVHLLELGAVRAVRDLWPCWRSRAASPREATHVDLHSCGPGQVDAECLFPCFELA